METKYNWLGTAIGVGMLLILSLLLLSIVLQIMLPNDPNTSVINESIESFHAINHANDYRNVRTDERNNNSKCMPNETDRGEYCVKKGCPVGMERGYKSGSDFCYPRCAPGYESDGGERCYNNDNYYVRGNGIPYNTDITQYDHLKMFNRCDGV